MKASIILVELEEEVFPRVRIGSSVANLSAWPTRGEAIKRAIDYTLEQEGVSSIEIWLCERNLA